MKTRYRPAFNLLGQLIGEHRMLPRLCPKCGFAWVIQQFRWQKDGQHDWLGEHLVSETTYWAGQLSMQGRGVSGPLMIVSEYSRRISRGVMMSSWERWV